MIITCNQKLVWHFIAILLSALGSLMLFVDRFIIQEEVRKEVTLKNDSEYLNQWRNDTTPVVAKFYVFNITNSHSIKSGNESVIQMDPIGPFVFDVQRDRNILDVNDSIIEYQPLNFFTYDTAIPGNQPLDQVVSIPNVPLVVIAKKSLETGSWSKRVASYLAAMTCRSDAFTDRSVRELLFEGYKDDLFAVIKVAEEVARLPGAELIPDEFAIMKDKNGLPAYGNWTVLRGYESEDQTLQIIRWNDEEQLAYFPKGSECNQLKGNDGSKFRSGVRESDVLFLFLVADFCAAIPFAFDSYSTVGNIETMRFKFRFNDSSNMACLQDSGVIDVSACNLQAPIFLSGPHFFQGSELLTRGIEGLLANESLHETFMDVEPTTGLILRIVVRLQVNVKMSKDSIFRMTRNLPFDEKIIPILWVEQFAEASAESLSKLDRLIFAKVRALKYTAWSLIAAGTLIATAIYAIALCKKMRSESLAGRLVKEELVADSE